MRRDWKRMSSNWGWNGHRLRGRVGHKQERQRHGGRKPPVEWQPWKALEITLAYARMKRAEADERRTGRATGDLIRTQVQWNY